MSASVEGHQLSIQLIRHGYKRDVIHCSCGWGTSRHTFVVSAPTERDSTKTRKQLEPLGGMRDRGQQHLYDSWKALRQGVLDV
jgi:hypothetical protein